MAARVTGLGSGRPAFSSLFCSQSGRACHCAAQFPISTWGQKQPGAGRRSTPGLNKPFPQMGLDRGLGCTPAPGQRQGCTYCRTAGVLRFHPLVAWLRPIPAALLLLLPGSSLAFPRAPSVHALLPSPLHLSQAAGPRQVSVPASSQLLSPEISKKKRRGGPSPPRPTPAQAIASFEILQPQHTPGLSLSACSAPRCPGVCPPPGQGKGWAGEEKHPLLLGNEDIPLPTHPPTHPPGRRCPPSSPAVRRAALRCAAPTCAPQPRAPPADTLEPPGRDSRQRGGDRALSGLAAEPDPSPPPPGRAPLRSADLPAAGPGSPLAPPASAYLNSSVHWEQSPAAPANIPHIDPA